MKLPRPHIPLNVRLSVAARQLGFVLPAQLLQLSKRNRLAQMLQQLFGNAPRQPDHEPALCLRPFDEATGKYEPDANDPNCLIYRDAAAHKIKTSRARKRRTA